MAGDQRIEVTVLMRPSADHDAATTRALLGATAPADRDHLDLQTLEMRRGTSATDLATVEAFAKHYDLDVSDRHPERRSVTLSGTADQMQAAFRVSMATTQTAGRTYRVRTSAVRVPKELEQIVRAVVGFDTRPQMIPHIRTTAGMASSDLNPFTPLEVANLYRFPANTSGRGETVAILEFGGGFDTNDLNTYFGSIGITDPPRVIGIAVDGASTSANQDTGADGEVQLDIDVVGAVAPGSTVVVYFAPNSARGFVDAIKSAIHNPDHRPCAISISWGMAEENWSQQTRDEMDQSFQDAGMLGITICAASGDDGSTDNQTQGAPHVDYPAASPWVLGCGGTQLVAANGSITSETVWNDADAGGGASGGGISTLYDRPAWQNAIAATRPGATTNGRGVPDIAGDACPSTGYQVRVDGHDTVVGGHQRRGAAMGRADRASDRGHEHLDRVYATAALRPAARGASERHQGRQQRRLPGRRRLGPVYRAGQPGRHPAASVAAGTDDGDADGRRTPLKGRPDGRCGRGPPHRPYREGRAAGVRWGSTAGAA